MNCANVLRACVHFIKFRYFFPNICCYLSAFFLEPTSSPHRNHSITTELPSNTFPIPFPYTPYTLRSTLEKSHQNAIFLAYPQILLYLCNLNAKLSNYTWSIPPIKGEARRGQTDSLWPWRHALCQITYGVANAM